MTDSTRRTEDEAEGLAREIAQEVCGCSLPAGNCFVIPKARPILARFLRERDREKDNEICGHRLAEAENLLVHAWGIIANVSEGDWTRQSPTWQTAAAGWRDEWIKPSNAQPVPAAPAPVHGKAQEPVAEDECNGFHADDCPPSHAPLKAEEKAARRVYARLCGPHAPSPRAMEQPGKAQEPEPVKPCDDNCKGCPSCWPIPSLPSDDLARAWNFACEIREPLDRGEVVRDLVTFLRADRVSRGKAQEPPNPTPMLLRCPNCNRRHIDEDEWATRPHKTHRCASCGHEWRPFEYATVGVAEPGKAQEPEPPKEE